jgi:F0F1-type ATP synthase membrane subunit b/b'
VIEREELIENARERVSEVGGEMKDETGSEIERMLVKKVKNS